MTEARGRLACDGCEDARPGEERDRHGGGRDGQEESRASVIKSEADQRQPQGDGDHGAGSQARVGTSVQRPPQDERNACPGKQG